jgi:hypothetical protein
MGFRIALSSLTAILVLDSTAGSQESSQRDRLREANRRVLEAVEKELAKPESRPADINARAELLGRDPARIVAFVQKEIRFEPYPGLQRGPAGVLIAGSGNALDKSFLLMELLKAAGGEARMVKGSLPDERCLELVRSWLDAVNARPADRWKGPFGLGGLDRKRVEGSCREAGVAAEEVIRMLRAREKAEDAAWQDVRILAAREKDFLAGLLVGGRALPVAPMLQTLVLETRHHAWVQWKGKGAPGWTDVEACLAASPGIAPQGALDPATAADRLTLTLSLERKTGGKRETVEVLKREIAVHETLLDPVRFTIQPTEFRLPRPGEPYTAEDHYRQLGSAKEFVATVLTGDQASMMMVFDYEGNVSKPQLSAGKIGGSSGATAGKVAGLFENAREKEKGTLVRLWMDLGISREGNQPLFTQRREILEEGGRATWCPVLSWDFFLPVGEISEEFVRYIHRLFRVRNQDAVRSITSWAESKDHDIAQAAKARAVHYPVDLLTFSVARQAYAEQVSGASRNWLHFDRPNVFLSGRQAKLLEKQKDVCLCQGIDIVENGALVVTAGADAALDPEGAMALGAFDSVLEQSRVAAANPQEAAASAVTFFERARILGRPMRLLDARDPAPLLQAGLSKGDAEGIAARAPDRGFALIVTGMDPAHCGGSCAWWEFDRTTGRVLGRLSGGRGGSTTLLAPKQDLAEYAELLSQINNSVCLGKVVGALLVGKEAEAKDQAIDCITGMVKSEALDMAGLGVINFVRDLLDFGETAGWK